MSMSEFRIPIMFRRVGRCSEMSYTIGREKGSKGLNFAPFICVKCFNGGGEIVFIKLLEGNKGGMNIRFST